MKILILGEMDFSFAVSLANKHKSSTIIATSFACKKDIIEECVSSRKRNANQLEQMGCEVVPHVDATELIKNKFASVYGLFDAVYFILPRHQTMPSSQQANEKLIKDVFTNVESVIDPNKMHHFNVVLHISKKQENDSSKWQLNAWNMQYRNWYIESQRILPFSEFQEEFSGYIPRNGNGKTWRPFKLHWVVFVDPESSSCDSSLNEMGEMFHAISLEECELISNMIASGRSESSSDSSEEWDVASICSSITALSMVSNKDRLCLLDAKLKYLHEQQGVSKKSIKKAIKKKGICLKDCKEYGSASALKKRLKSNKRSRIKKKKLKHYKYAQMCLVQWLF